MSYAIYKIRENHGAAKVFRLEIRSESRPRPAGNEVIALVSNIANLVKASEILMRIHASFTPTQDNDNTSSWCATWVNKKKASRGISFVKWEGDRGYVVYYVETIQDLHALIAFKNRTLKAPILRDDIVPDEVRTLGYIPIEEYRMLKLINAIEGALSA